MKDIVSILENDSSDYIFNILKIENHNSNSNSRLRFWFDHCKKNINDISGDIFEFGVFRGQSIISMGILLKRLGSSKKIYGFDSFSGFPNYHENDSLDKFNELRGDLFESEISRRIELVTRLKKELSNIDSSQANISSSGEFNDTSYDAVKSKIELFGLDNIELIEGDFRETVPAFFKEKQKIIFSANIDCDLYDGYKICLPYISKYLQVGGYVHLDEYYSIKFPGARIACEEFLSSNDTDLSLEKNDTPKEEFERWYLEKK